MYFFKQPKKSQFFHPQLNKSIGQTLDRICVVNLNSLAPKSAQHLISPYNITPESHIKVMRIMKMINNYRSSGSLS